MKLKKTVSRAHSRGGVLNFKFTEDSCHAVTCGQDRTLILWNPWKGLKVKTYENGHHGPVIDCSIARNRATMISAGQHDKYLLNWDLSTGKIIRRLGTHDLGLTSCLLLGPSDNVVASGSVDKTVAFWDLRDRNSRRPLQVLADAYDTVTDIAWEEPQLITTSLDGFLRRYDLRFGNLTCNFLHHPLTGLQLTHSSSDKSALAMGLNGVLTLVDLSLSDRGRNATLNHYTGFVNDSGIMKCQIDLEDSFVIASSDDGHVYVWDIATTQPKDFTHVTKDAHDGRTVNGVRVINDNEETRRKMRLKDAGFLDNPTSILVFLHLHSVGV